MSLRKVVITGMGAISPFGIGVKPLMEGLYAGQSAVVSLKSEWEEQVKDLNCWVGAPIKESLPSKSISRQYRRTMGPTAIMSLLAANEATGEAGISETVLTSGRTGVSFSSSTGSAESLTQYFKEYFSSASLKNISSGSFFQVMSHTCAANIAHALNIKGRVISPDAACSSSTQAIGLGYEAIKYGLQDFMLCGGSDELDAIVCGSFDLLNATSCRFNDRPTETPRPFDRDRDGTVCGEGAGCIILESEESAIRRGAVILAEIIGFSTLSDGTHLAQSHSDSIVRCMENALDNSNLTPKDIDYINAHATGTIQGDISEAGAIRKVFGGRGVPVSSLKGHMGHTLGASGALELAASVRMLNDGVLIPTLNLKNPGEGCNDGVNHLMELKRVQITTFLKNSFAFGGINSILVIRRYINRND
ncbi:MAG: beta-ketoacyl-[acyl-carrier-protein] synthase family protein [Nitrospirae bacterium]|nr:beta-ketoacyl-[acyl-carrier-protein] synthase family protein [Nitrospirota bacterium]